MNARKLYQDTLFALVKNAPEKEAIAYIDFLVKQIDKPEEILNARDKDLNNTVQAALIENRAALVNKLLDHLQPNVAPLFSVPAYNPVLITAIENDASDHTIQRMLNLLWKHLPELKTNLLFKTNRNGTSALIAAASRSRLSTIKALLQLTCGLSDQVDFVNRISKEGTALSIVCSKNESAINDEIIVLLLAANADLMISHEPNYGAIDTFMQFPMLRIATIFNQLTKDKQQYVLRCMRLRDYQQHTPSDITLKVSSLYDLQTLSLLQLEKQLGNKIMLHMLDQLQSTKKELFEVCASGQKKPNELLIYQVRYNDLQDVKNLRAKTLSLQFAANNKDRLRYHVATGLIAVGGVIAYAAGICFTVIYGNSSLFSILQGIFHIAGIPVIAFGLTLGAHYYAYLHKRSEYDDLRQLLQDKIARKIEHSHLSERQIEAVKKGLTYCPLTKNDLTTLKNALKAFNKRYVHLDDLLKILNWLLNMYDAIELSLYGGVIFQSNLLAECYQTPVLNTRQINEINPPKVVFVKERKELLLPNPPKKITKIQMAFSVFGKNRPSYHDDPYATPSHHFA